MLDDDDGRAGGGAPFILTPESIDFIFSTNLPDELYSIRLSVNGTLVVDETDRRME